MNPTTCLELEFIISPKSPFSISLLIMTDYPPRINMGRT